MADQEFCRPLPRGRQAGPVANTRGPSFTPAQRGPGRALSSMASSPLGCWALAVHRACAPCAVRSSPSLDRGREAGELRSLPTIPGDLKAGPVLLATLPRHQDFKCHQDHFSGVVSLCQGKPGQEEGSGWSRKPETGGSRMDQLGPAT